MRPWADETLVARRKGDEILGGMQDVGPQTEAHRHPAEGSPDESPAVDIHAGMVDCRISRLEGEVNGVLRADLDTVEANDALRAVGLHAVHMDGSDRALAGAEIALVAGIAHPPAQGRPLPCPAEQGPQRADVPAPEAGLEAPQPEQERKKHRHEGGALEGRQRRLEVAQFQPACPGADGA
jgi:hypothetical protein